MGTKKSLLRRATAFALAFVMAFSMLFTGNTAITANAAATATKIKVAEKSISIEPGKTAKIKVTVKGSNKKFTAKSSNKKVATVKVVGKNVVIKAKNKLGKTAKITVTTKGKNKKGKKLSAKITVKVAKAEPTTEATTAATTAATTTEDATAKKAEADKAAATPVATAISALPAATAVTTADEATITSARKAYDALTADQKALVRDVLKKLTDAEAALKKLKDESKLEKITVSASPTSITEKGGQSKITVVSDPAGISISSIVYSSKNTQIATVDTDGTVTGVNPGTVIISITAKDANGNTAEGTATITVTPANAINATISFTDADKTGTLSIGDTKTLRPIITADVTDYSVEWESSNSSVATVDSEGLVTAVGPGSVTITATVKGTNAKAASAITVSATSPSVKELKATHADVLTLYFTSAVADSDRDKINISLKFGETEQTFEKEWASDGKSVDLRRRCENEEGTYTVTISATDVALGSKKEAVGTVAARTISNLNIKTDYVPYYQYTKVFYDVLDQYGDVMKNVSANQFTWSVSSEKASVDATNAVYNTNNGAIYDETGYIVINTRLENLVPDEDKLTVFGYLTSNNNVKQAKKIGVNYLAAQHMEITGVKEDKVYQSNIDRKVELTYIAKDNLGGDVDLEAYFNRAYTASITSTSADETKVTAPIVTEEGKLTVTVKAGAVGKVKVTVSGKDNVLSDYEIEILDAPVANTVKFPAANAINVVAGETAKIPVVFVDQYGDDLKQGTVTADNFSNLFSVVANGLTGISADDVTYHSNATEDYIEVDTSDVTSAGTINIRLTSGNDVDSKFALEVTAPRAASKIDIETAPKTSIMVGETTQIKFKILDNHGVQWTNDNTYIIDGDAIFNNDYIRVGDAIINNGIGTIDITGLASTKKASAQTITLNLKTADNSRFITTQPITYSINVEDNLTELDADVDVNTVKAGQKVKITLTAKDSDDKILDQYDETIKALRVFESVKGAFTTIEEVTFVNGIATIEVEADKVGDAVTYSGSFTSPGNNDATSFITKGIKIEAGDPNKFNVSIADNSIVITYLDVKDNVVVSKNVDPAVATITIKDEDGDNVTNKYLAPLDQNGKYTLERDEAFIEGVAEVNTIEAIPAKYTVSVSFDGIEGSATVK